MLQFSEEKTNPIGEFLREKFNGRTYEVKGNPKTLGPKFVVYATDENYILSISRTKFDDNTPEKLISMITQQGVISFLNNHPTTPCIWEKDEIRVES